MMGELVLRKEFHGMSRKSWVVWSVMVHRVGDRVKEEFHGTLRESSGVVGASQHVKEEHTCWSSCTANQQKAWASEEFHSVSGESSGTG